MKHIILGLVLALSSIQCSSHKENVPQEGVSASPTGAFYGYDILGLAMQPLQTIKDNYARGMCIGVLEGTFGQAIPPTENLINSGLAGCWRIHLGNGACLRAGNCGPGEIKPTDFGSIRTRARLAGELNRRHPNLPCFISPYLEHDVKDKSVVDQWLRIIKEEAPGCKPVISALTGYIPPGVLIERHGNEAKGDIISNDGASVFDSNVDKYKGGGKRVVFFWTHRFNLRYSGEKTFTQPRKRTAVLQASELVQINRLRSATAPLPAWPVQCVDRREIKAPEIGKVRSEDFNNGDPRGHKPMFISKVKAPSFEVLAPGNGIKVGSAKYYGPYSGGPGLHRYYVGSGSGDNPVQLMDKQRNEWGFWKSGRTCYAYNAIRRLGSYR